MSSKQRTRGKAIPLSPMRRFIGDLLHAAAAMPSIPVQRRMRLASVVAARRAKEQPPSWPAIFIKAYAKVMTAMPELRRAYVKFPWPHLYEYAETIASVAVERDFQGSNEIFIGQVKDPARMSLAEVHRAIRYLKEAQIEECNDFRRILRLSRVPWPFRRGLWWLGLNIGRIRRKHFGTFGLSVYSSLGAESLHPISPLTTTLNYGVIAPDGTVDVRIVYDHRVLNGSTVARSGQPGNGIDRANSGRTLFNRRGNS